VWWGSTWFARLQGAWALIKALKTSANLHTLGKFHLSCSVTLRAQRFLARKSEVNSAKVWLLCPHPRISRHALSHKFWRVTLAIYLNAFSRSTWHSFGHIFRHSNYHFMWYPIWHSIGLSSWHIISDILARILSDIPHSIWPSIEHSVWQSIRPSSKILHSSWRYFCHSSWQSTWRHSIWHSCTCNILQCILHSIWRLASSHYF